MRLEPQSPLKGVRVAWWGAHSCARLASSGSRRVLAFALLGTLVAASWFSHEVRADNDLLAPCLSEPRREKLLRTTRAARDQQAFRSSGIWLPPLYVSDSTRRFRWLAGLFAEFSDPEGNARTRLLLPLFLSDCRPESRLLVTPLFGYRRDREGIAGVVGPYFYRRDFLAQSDVLFPLVWSLRERETQGGEVTWRNTAVVPFYFDWQRGDRRTVLVPPLLSARLVRGLRTTWITGPVFRSTRPGGWSAGVLPLWVGGRDGDRRWDVVPPLLLHREAWPGHLRVRVGLATYRRDPERWRLGVPPLLWAGGDASRHYTVALPLFADWEKRDRFRFTLVGPFFRYHRRRGQPPRDPGLLEALGIREVEEAPSDDRLWVSGLLPLWVGGRKGETRWDLLPPLLLYRHRGPLSTTFTALGSWFHSNAQGFSLGLTPLVFVARWPERSHTIVAPFYGHLVSRDRETTFVGPAWSHHGPRGFSAGLAPLWFSWGSKKVDGVRRTRVDLLPALLTLRIRDGKRLRLWSVNSWFFRDGDNYQAGSFPFFFASREGKRHALYLSPLLAYHGGDGEEETTVVLGSWYRTRPDGYSLGLTPLLFAGREGKRRHFILFPLVWDFDDGWTRSTLVLNAYLQRRLDGWRASFFPFYFGGKTGDARWDLLPPIFLHFGDRKEDTWILGPLYRRHTGLGWHAGLMGVYHGGRSATFAYDVIPPLLFARFRDEDGTRLWALNTWVRWRPDGSFNVSSFPFVFAGRKARRHWLTIPPLLFHHSGREVDGRRIERTLVGPLYLARNGERRTRAFFPLFYSRRTPDRSLDLALPGFYRLRDASGWEAGFLPFWAGGKNARRTFHVIPPLFAYYQKRDEVLRVGLLNTRYVKRPEGHSFTFFPLVFEGRRGAKRHLVIPPLWADFSTPTRRLTLAMGGVFYRLRDARGVSLGLFPLVFASKTRSTFSLTMPLLLTHIARTPEASTTWVGPVYLRRTETTRTTLVGPFFSRRTPRSTTTVLGPAFYHRRAGRWNAGLFPLFFAGGGEGHAHAVLPPLFYYSHDAGRTRATLFPLLHYRRDGARSTLYTPLAYYQSRPDGHAFYSPLGISYRAGERRLDTVVGLYWRGTSPSLEATVVAPFYWDLRFPKTGTRFTALAPLYFRHETPEEKTQIFLNVAWSSGTGPRGPSSSFRIVPFYSRQSYHPGHLKWQLFEGLLGFEREGERRRYRAFYIWTRPRDRVRRSSARARGPAPADRPG